MPKTTSWYSARGGTEVYHNNSGCTEVNNIEAYNVREGTGDKRLCHHCERLNREESYHNKLGLAGLLGGRPSSILNAFFEAQKEHSKK